MKKVKIICPTYRQAVFAWETAQKAIPSLWMKSTKNPLTLTSIVGNQYIFDVNNPRGLLGWHSDTLIMDEFVGMLDELKGE